MKRVDNADLSRNIIDLIDSEKAYTVADIQLEDGLKEKFLLTMCAGTKCCSVVPFSVLLEHGEYLMNDADMVTFKVQCVNVSVREGRVAFINPLKYGMMFRYELPVESQHFFIYHDGAVAEVVHNETGSTIMRHSYVLEVPVSATGIHDEVVVEDALVPKKEREYRLVEYSIRSALMSFMQSGMYADIRDITAIGTEQYAGSTEVEMLFVRDNGVFYALSIPELVEGMRNYLKTRKSKVSGYVQAVVVCGKSRVRLVYDCYMDWIIKADTKGITTDMVFEAVDMVRFEFLGGETAVDIRITSVPATCAEDFSISNWKVNMPTDGACMVGIVSFDSLESLDNAYGRYVENSVSAGDRHKEDVKFWLGMGAIGVLISVVSVVVDRIFRRK